MSNEIYASYCVLRKQGTTTSQCFPILVLARNVNKPTQRDNIKPSNLRERRLRRQLLTRFLLTRLVIALFCDGCNVLLIHSAPNEMYASWSNDMLDRSNEIMDRSNDMLDRSNDTLDRSNEIFGERATSIQSR
ncbi:hypothetical protein TNCV_4877241 [Trichonephila clavipes]|nr:hypothetical protein TNCV_4877241 [Trichonephila clavipes]